MFDKKQVFESLYRFDLNETVTVKDERSLCEWRAELSKNERNQQKINLEISLLNNSHFKNIRVGYSSVYILDTGGNKVELTTLQYNFYENIWFCSNFWSKNKLHVTEDGWTSRNFSFNFEVLSNFHKDCYDFSLRFVFMAFFNSTDWSLHPFSENRKGDELENQRGHWENVLWREIHGCCAFIKWSRVQSSQVHSLWEIPSFCFFVCPKGHEGSRKTGYQRCKARSHETVAAFHLCWGDYQPWFSDFWSLQGCWEGKSFLLTFSNFLTISISSMESMTSRQFIKNRCPRRSEKKTSCHMS